jgi:hypothetical protein
MTLVRVVAFGGPKDGLEVMLPGMRAGGMNPVRAVFPTGVLGPPTETGEETLFFSNYHVVWACSSEAGEYVPKLIYEGEVAISREEAASLEDPGCPDDREGQ